jgi:hypothetical protein
MMREWKDSENRCSYQWQVKDGRIVAQVHNIAHTTIWLAKIINNYNDESYIGEYISMETAKAAVETYWNIQERTLPNDTTS